MAMRRNRAKTNPFAAANKVGYVRFTIGVEASDVINVGLQFQDANHRDLAERTAVRAFLSDDAHGDSLIASAPGTTAIGTDGVAIELVTKKVWEFVSEADGDLDLNITKTGAATMYLVVILPDGSLVVSGAITFAA